MFNTLTEATKNRILYELRRFWSYDPNYKDTLVPNIQGKYSFEARPCMSIVLKNSSANTFALSADNFQGTVVSYCSLAKVEDNPGLAIEWIREDTRAIIENGGDFPSVRGIYYIEVREETVDFQGVTENRKVFYVDPLLDAIDEQPTKVTDFIYQLAHYPFHDGSLRLYELPGNIELVEGINYTVDATTGRITLLEVLPSRLSLSADYRYPGTSTGPYVILDNHTNVVAIPGVVLAFGRRSSVGDVMAVIVGDRREPVALEYGGRWEINLDMDISAKDVNTQAEIADRTMLYLNGVARNHLSTEGLEITQVSHGGESEEPFDETADDYFYMSSVSITVMTEWAIHVPLTQFIQRVLPQTSEDYDEMAALTDDQLVANGEINRIQGLQNLGLQAVQDPFFRRQKKTYEVIR